MGGGGELKHRSVLLSTIDTLHKSRLLHEFASERYKACSRLSDSGGKRERE